MRAAALALAAILLAAPVFAGQTEYDVTTDAVQTALQARGTEDYVEAKAVVYDIVTDPLAAPACRVYADVMLAGLLLIDVGEPYPESQSLGMLLGQVMEYAPVARNNCLLAV